MDRLHAHIRDTLLPSEQPVVLGGDYNICPSDEDTYDPITFADDALCRAESRGRFRATINLCLTDAWRALHRGEPKGYSYWDYQRGAWQRDEGLRIDRLLRSPPAPARLTASELARGGTPAGTAKGGAS